LGQYLREIDPQKTDVALQVIRLVIFCQIHFKRGIKQVLKRGEHHHGAAERMESILYCSSKDDYMKVCNTLISKY